MNFTTAHWLVVPVLTTIHEHGGKRAKFNKKMSPYYDFRAIVQHAAIQTKNKKKYEEARGTKIRPPQARPDITEENHNVRNHPLSLGSCNMNIRPVHQVR